VLAKKKRDKMTMNELNNTKPTWFSSGVIGGVVSVAAGLLGFLDYLVPTATQNLCIDVEEGISDLYIAALALLGGILAIHGRIKVD
jgi:hypothetical protein